MKKMKTVKELYQVTKLNEEPLLSDYNAEWWADYVSNFTDFDAMFAKMFKTFVYYDQDSEDTTADIQADFTQTVERWLRMNDKRYAELYRIHVIPDDDSYNLAYNYDRHETYSGNNTVAGSAITGQRTDVNIDEIGEQHSSNLDKVTGWNSSAENNNTSNDTVVGNRNDVNQFTKGQQEDTSRTQGNDAHTSHIFGNIGVTTVDDMLKKHNDFWQVFNFYQIVFDDICKNFLLIGR